jgi:CRISPR-associated RAMP protein (TIGR02581 family)
MLKTLVNECLVTLQIEPTGPVLIKSGGASISGPDMAFVRVWRNGTPEVYIPGSSLKGVLRSHAERIVRTIGPEGETIACDPFTKEGPAASCGYCFEALRPDRTDIPEELKPYRLPKESDLANQRVYAHCCLICRLFGSTFFAGRLATADAYAVGIAPGAQTRDGVGIDRFTGGASEGAKFDLEVITGGRFETTLHIRNFELWQLGLLGFLIRDMEDGLLRIGSGRSRGLGQVRGKVERVELYYLGKLPEEEPIRGRISLWGMGALAGDGIVEGYGLKPPHRLDIDIPAGFTSTPGVIRTKQTFSGETFPWETLAKEWVNVASAHEEAEAMKRVRAFPRNQ